MTTIKIDLDPTEYALAIARKGNRTWRKILLDGLKVAHDARRLGRPHGLDNMYVDQNPKAKAGELDKLYTGLDERLKEHRKG